MLKKMQTMLVRAGRILMLPAMLAAFLLPGATVVEGMPLRNGMEANAAGAVGGVQHIFVILMENKGYTEVWNTTSTPYITQLGKSYARATAYYAIGHPSLPNYLEMYGGSNFGITTDCSPSPKCHVSHWSLGADFINAGISYRLYMESMPKACDLSTSGNYAPKHNPAIYFDGTRLTWVCQYVDVPFTAFAKDLASAATTPRYVFISPNQCSDMHSCSIKTGDDWLKAHVPAILSSQACTLQKCLVIVTWDEDNGSQGNHVLTIFAGSAAKTGGAVSAVPYNHYSLMRTVEYLWGLPPLTSNDAAARPMIDLLR